MTVQVRLDEQFPIAANDPLAPTFRRLMKALEIRFQALEEQRKAYEQAILEFKTAALEKINVELLPASEQIVAYATLGFLVAHSTTSLTLAKDAVLDFIVDEGPVRDLFTPTVFCGVQHEEGVNNFAIAHVQSYSKQTGALRVQLLSVYGDPGPWDNWVISAAPGVSEVTRIYYERAFVAAQQAEGDAAMVAEARGVVESAAQALGESGVNPDNFAWRDGSRSFTAIQHGVATATTRRCRPPPGLGRASPRAWLRSRRARRLP